MILEVYRQPRLTDPYDLGPFRRDLQTGVKPESLEPNGLFTTNNDQVYWSYWLLGRVYPADQIGMDENGLFVQDITKTYRKITRLHTFNLRHVSLREHLYVGSLGFLLYEDQDMFDEQRILRMPEAKDDTDWFLKQAIQVRVDPRHQFQWVDLLDMGMYGLQDRFGENDFVVISANHRILPRAIKVVEAERPLLLS